MLTASGHAKVMDFGLAKLKGSLKLTKTSSTVGTLAYMAPEQVQGGEVDHRSDIFSFGVLLFEMLTGQLPFRGEHEAAMLYSILHETPLPVQSMRSDAPSELDHVVQRALEKDPADRYQNMDDLVSELRRLEKRTSRVVRVMDPISGTSSTAPQAMSSRGGVSPTVLGRAPGSNRRHMFGWVAAISLAGLVIVYVTGAFDALLTPALPPMKTVAFTSGPGVERGPAFSPDGKSIAFSWRRESSINEDVYVKLIDAGDPLRLTSSPAAEYNPAWSPDGRFIAFTREESDHATLFAIPSLGGTERRIADIGASSQGIDWSPDGASIVAAVNDGDRAWNIVLISAETGEKRVLVGTNDGLLEGVSSPKFSPDGRQISYIRSFSYSVAEVFTVPSGGGTPVQLTFDSLMTEGVSWMNDGKHLVFSSNRGGTSTLWRMSSSGGKPEAVPGAGDDVIDVDIAPTGHSLAFARQTIDRNIWLIHLSAPGVANGAPGKLIFGRNSQAEMEFSPDGRWIVYASHQTGSGEIWRCMKDGTARQQLTFFRGTHAGSPRWSPDGRLIAFDSRASGTGQVYLVDADGGSLRQLTSGAYENNVPAFSRDGQWVYFSSERTGTYQIWKIAVDGSREVQVTKGGGFSGFESDDGAVFYYCPTRFDRIMTVSPQGGDEKVLDPKLPRVRWGAWQPTRSGIYFAVEDPKGGYRVHHYDFRTRQIREVVVSAIPLFPHARMIAVAPDEDSIILAQEDEVEGDIYLIQNFR